MLIVISKLKNIDILPSAKPRYNLIHIIEQFCKNSCSRGHQVPLCKL